MTSIRRLPEYLINQIAAGEVIERPASAIKELVENSLDAGASEIIITIRDGGKSLIDVQDNGRGMGLADMRLAVERHATSKLAEDDLNSIRYLGFRGEALASIASVGRLRLDSRQQGSEEAWSLTVEGGEASSPKPSPRVCGTRVELRDLFYAVPARLKFLRSDRAESMAVVEVVERLAMAAPHCSFELWEEGKRRRHYSAIANSFAHDKGQPADSQLARLRQVMGPEFSENAVKIALEREGVQVSGYAGLPTFHRASASHQFLYVNQRAVKDRQLSGAVRAAYQDYLARDRHPMLALFITLPSSDVDVNVHPAKAEVRFRDSGMIRGLMISALRLALDQGSHHAANHNAQAALQAFQTQPGVLATGSSPVKLGVRLGGQNYQNYQSGYTRNPAPHLQERARQFQMPAPLGGASGDWSPSAPTGYAQDQAGGGGAITLDQPNFPPSDEDRLMMEAETHFPLGAARAQLHQTYIVTQTAEGIAIVDQHAAHERLVYEKLKRSWQNEGIKSQPLLIPEIIELADGAVQDLLNHSEELAKLGLEIEGFGQGAVIVRQTPLVLAGVDLSRLLRDLSDEIKELGGPLSLQERILAVAASMACHGSVRAGRRLNHSEMNELLREMEATPHSGQCNHGRPTYISLKLSDIERLFGRS